MPEDQVTTASSTETTAATSTQAAVTTQSAASAESSHKQDTFPREYVEGLRREVEGYRKQAREAQTAKEKAQEDAAKAAEVKVAEAAAKAEEAQKKLAEFTERANQRTIRDELNSLAKEAGLVDIDGLKLADLSGVKLDENGNVTGAKEAVDALKTAKPFLFGERKKNTTQTNPAPNKTDPKPFDARTATPEELQAHAKASGIKIRFN